MSWRRMFAASLVGMKGWFSTRCALTWKVKDTKSSRSYFLLQASTPRTAATESGLLPTVTTDSVSNRTKKYSQGGTPLTMAAQGLLLTPTTREEPVDLDKFKARMEKYPNGTTMPNLATQVQQMLPTPQANCSKGMNAQNVELRGNKLYNKKTGKQIQSSPEQWAKMGMLPTPNASDAKGGGTGETDYAHKHSLDRLKYTASTGMLPTPAAGDGHKTTSNTRQKNLNYLAPVGSGSQLSPLFVEEMMGFPKGWTASPFQSGDENP